MEMLTNSMLLGTDLWTIIINGFGKWLVNYGWAIIVFTICLKLVLSPLDVLQRTASQKQTKVMAIMQPELNALQQKYGNDKDKLNSETAKLYKKYNVSMGGMCFSLLITMIISVVVFFTLYGSLRSFGNDKLYSSYRELEQAYETAFEAVRPSETSKFADLTDQEKANIELQVEAKYDELKKQNSWLWVKNVWKGDINTSSFVEFEAYAINQNLEGTAKEQAQENYNIIKDMVLDGTDSQNGYYILIILCAVLSFLTQFLSAKLMNPKGQKLNTMNKVMFVVIPVTMFVLAMTSNVVFTLYVITNSLMTAIISTIISLVVRHQNSKNNGELVLPKKKVEVVEYSRNYKK